KVKNFIIADTLPSKVNFIMTIRYWDKAGTEGGGAYTVGVKMSQLTNDRWVVHDVVRGQWSSEVREEVITTTAVADGPNVLQYVEQEGGSGGKESAEATIVRLSRVGIACRVDHPTGSKELRADTYSVQVNRGRVILHKGEWNTAYIEELRYFPFGTYKDQVDASSGAYNMLTGKRVARRIV
ncbi:MAG: phage terminase large subunit, partial [Gammaproteobacteria bacterium]|nr:phage terminase large subunit [Gammaproteobacteria bacterium]